MTDENLKKNMAVIQKFLRQMYGPYTTSEKIQKFIAKSIRFLFELSISVLILVGILYIIIATPFFLYKFYISLKHLIW